MKKIFFFLGLCSTLLSCNSDNFDKPSKHEIISDLIGQETKGWNFLNREEFKTFDIISTRIIDSDPLAYNDDKLQYTINSTYNDYYTKKEYRGEITVIYKLNDNLKWIFDEVTGEIRANENQSKNEIEEKRKKSTEQFLINYKLELKEEKQQCPSCSHLVIVEYIKTFPKLSFEEYEDEIEMKKLWEKHKNKIISEYNNFWWKSCLTNCPKKCKGVSSCDFITVDVTDNTIDKTFERQ